MKRKIINFLLIVGFCACVFWGMTADGMVALIPLVLSICIGLGGVYYNTDYLKNH